MSWFSDNYEKVALAGTVVVAVVLGYSGLQGLNAFEKDFSSVPKGSGPNDPAVKDGDKVAMAISSLEISRKWDQSDDSSGRVVDLFTGVPLFVNKNNPKQPVDLPKSADVHPPIPNQWWIDYRIDPGYGDSPQRDEDEDGFTNLEEFLAKTDPTDNRSHPNLIQKLVYVSDESIEWVLRPGGYPTAEEPGMTFEYFDLTNNKTNRVGAGNPVPVNGAFFATDPAKGRFKYLGFETKNERNDRIQADVEVVIAKIEDLKPNKKGTIYEIPANFRRSDARQLHLKHDRTAVLVLEALGKNGQEFRVEELMEFALPEDAEEKRFKLMQVTPDRIVIQEILEDKTTQTHEIPKRR
jgi:hypothetical protein